MDTRDEHPPPWRKYPDIPAGDLGWRMGAGEDYLGEWGRWLMALGQDERRRYLTGLGPIPEAWRELIVELYAHPLDAQDDAVYDATWAALFGQETS